ncbi:MAG: alginate export family protein [Verrucomicrobiia bacterium]
MRKNIIIGVIVLLMTVGINVYAQNGSTSSAQTVSRLEKFLQDSKKPTSWLSLGGDLRLRNEYLNNAISLDEDAPRSEQDYLRFRGRIWTTITPADNFDFNVRLTAEPRNYLRPSYHKTPITGQDWTEGIIDILNFKWKQAFGLPLTMTIGRQDLMLGDPLNWWLVGDGTPLDGSRTYFLDAARLTWDIKDYNTTIDTIGIFQDAMNDAWLPPINHLEKALTDQDEKGAILYISNKSIKNTQIDVYYMYKNDDARPGLTAGQDANIHTVGSKITGNITSNLSYSVEGAYQFGERRKPGTQWQDINAFGVNNRLTYAFKDALDTKVRFSHEFISGDDPSTGDYEQFNMLWGRWPRWSELYIYSYVKESSVAQNNNVHRFGPGIIVTPIKDVTFSTDYNALFADQKANGVYPFGNGDFRGHFLQSVLKVKFSKHVSGHLWGEFLWAGDYYAKRDLFTFVRTEIYFTW